MRRGDDIKAHLLATFRVEAGEHLATLRGQLLELDTVPSPELVEACFRTMHTLKGAARSVGLLELERRCQDCESLLSDLNRRGAVPGAAELARLENAVAEIGATLGDDPAPATEPRPAAAPDDTIRLASGKLDALLLRGEELLALKLAADERAREADALVAEVTRLRRTDDGAELRAVEGSARALLARLQDDRRTAQSAVDGLLDETRRARMMPASTVLDLFPRMVRDLAAGEGKEARWSARGADLEIDRKVLEAIKDPLIHVVRNAVGHGIEPVAEREAAGKPRRGRITATVNAIENRRIEIVVEDDGRGIDLSRVRDAAVRGRMLDSEGAAAMSDESALGLIYRSGLSTSFVITDVSGHGLGLAIVKERVEQLDGEIAVESRPGGGTAVRMTLPAAVATFRGLLVRAAGRPFLIPVAAVERVVAPGEGEAPVGVGDELVPVAPLADVLSLPTDEDSASPACVIVRGGGERGGLLVDELVGDTEVLVKELGRPLGKVRHVAGAGLLGTGDIVLILRPADLVPAVRARRTARGSDAPPKPSGPPLVLVVDDALTTRTMERSLLEAAGYRVDVAVDGMDAWTALQGDRFDLVVSDVDMPRMDGFELTTRIRSDERFADLPIVLVSALETREHKERGIEVGANAYVMKSSFEQSNLLDIIRRLGVTGAAA
jgi:two-component system, chemotaxis family, sensor kinase CheA